VTVEELDVSLLLGAVVILAAIAGVRLAHRIGLPVLLVFLGFGLALGENGLGVRFENAQIAQVLGMSALAIILAEGGLTTNWRDIRPAMPLAIALSTIGVGVSIAVVAGLAHLLLDLPWRLALLIGAVLASTDAAAVFSVLRRLPLPRKLAGALEGESGLNDAPAVIAVTLLSASTGHAPSVLTVVGEIAYELLSGAAIGVVVGLIGVYVLRRVSLPASGLYPIAVLALAVGSFAAASLAHGSGFLAVYASALVLGNARLPHRPTTRGFTESVAWIAQIGLFVMLGLLASPVRLPSAVVPAIIVGFVLVLLARPLSVFLSTFWLRVGWRQQGLLSWAGLRGAVPIVLATIPMSGGVPGATRLFDVVFVVVVLFTLLQGPTLPWVARRLGVTTGSEPIELDVESAPLEELHADLLQVRIPEDSKLAGVEIFELRLPVGANVTLVVRDGRSHVPGPATTLRAGDEMLVVTTDDVREVTERRLRAVSRAGKLAGWYGEHGR
jgi:cell volume regulation protein A